MTTAAIINKLFERFGATRVEVLGCSLDTIYVKIGARLYWIEVGLIVGQLSVEECVQGDMANVTPASEWIEGILRGRTRNDAGVLQ